MKYAIIKVVNGNYEIAAEGITSLSSAKTFYHGLCQTLWNAPDVITGAVMIVNEDLECVESRLEKIFHPIEEQGNDKAARAGKDS